MASISSNSTTITMKRPAEDRLLAKDINILDRLVWIKYESHWWPAIIYKSYSEVQQHLYRYLDTILKTQFAMAIMLEMNSSKPSKVARILGKPSVELIAVEPESYHEFYWNLAKMIRNGIDLTGFEDNVDKYLEFHQALDEIVEIFTIYSRKQEFELIAPGSGYRTWYEAATSRIRELDAGSSLDHDEGFEHRDQLHEYGSGRVGNRDVFNGAGQTSCLKKAGKFSSYSNASSRGPSVPRHRKSKRVDVNSEQDDCGHHNDIASSRDTPTPVSWPTVVPSMPSRPSVKLGRFRNGMVGVPVKSKPREARESQYRESGTRVEWE